MANKGKNHLKLFIHKAGSAAQRKHDVILEQLFAGSPIDRHHLIKSLDLINKLNVDQNTKQNYYGALINYSSTGDKDAAKSGVYSHAYVQAVIAADRALKPVWRADQTLLDVIALSIKTITARANYATFIIKQTINNRYKPLTFLHLLLTKIMPAHAPTAVIRDAA
jgi:hypothetical protein